MVILDTNVVSETQRPSPDESVMRWLNGIDRRNAAITAITVSEMRVGIARLPESRKKAALAQSTDRIVNEAYRGRVMPYDIDAAEYYGQLVTARERLGRPVSRMDAMIAAICLARGATLATRNVKDFDGTGIELVNPWDI